MKKIYSQLSKKEWKLIFLTSVILIVVTTIPYLLGYFLAPEGRVYSGLHALSPGDIPVYYSYISQAQEGELFVKNLFTSEDHAGILNLWWGGVGVMARVFNLTPFFSFQLARILMIPVFAVISYFFLSYFFPQKNKRLLSYIFLLFSSGIGFYFAAPLDALGVDQSNNYRWPIDLWLTEANTFNALYQTSHFTASLGLMLLMFLLMLKAFEKNKISLAVLAGVLGLFHFNFHPFYVPVMYGVLGLYLALLIWQAKKFLWNKIFYFLTFFIVSLPSVIYHFWLVQAVPAIQIRGLQNITNISPPAFILMGYGFLWLGLILGVYFLVKNKKFSNKHAFLLIWLAVNFSLIYAPFPFHSRYTQGLHVVLVIFTVFGLFGLYDYLKKKLSFKTFNFWVHNEALWLILFLLLFLPSTLYSVGRDLKFFLNPGVIVNENLFLPHGFIDTTKYLKTLPKGQVVLGADTPSKFIPGFSGQRIYLGHGIETLFFEAKEKELNYFYGGNENDRAKAEFLEKSGITHILYSSYEKNLGTFNPAEKEYLSLIFESKDVFLYEVNTD